MKQIKQLFSGAVVMAFLAGCSTIEYTNTGNVADSMEVYSAMHHNLAYSLYEYSEPVNLEQCGNGWASLVVEKDVITAIAGGIDEAIVFVDVWDPWAVTLNCAQ